MCPKAQALYVHVFTSKEGGGWGKNSLIWLHVMLGMLLILKYLNSIRRDSWGEMIGWLVEVWVMVEVWVGVEECE